MGNNVSNVSAAKPKTTGCIYVAPAGTALPAAADVELDEKFKNLGYVSEDGMTNTISKTTTKIKAWGGDTVLVTEDSFEESYQFKLIESKNVDVLKFVFGEDNVTGTLTTGIKVSKTSGNTEGKIIVVDTILSNNDLKRIVIPDGVVSSLGAITHKANEPIALDVTIECKSDATGNTSYDYMKTPTAG